MNTKRDDSSSSESDDDVIDSVASCSCRPKRQFLWCGVDTERTSDITWPPPTTEHSWRNYGNPLFGRKMQLYSKTRYNLAIYPDLTVRGTMDDNDLHTHLELISAGYTGHVRIQGTLTKLYVAMDSKGRLYAEPDMSEEGTVFIESFQGSYNTYLSRKYAHLGWYLGIKKSGRFKRGPKTNDRQKAVLFLPRRSKFD